MKYKAVFFDRDRTLTYADPEAKIQLNRRIESWGGTVTELSYDEWISLMDRAGYDDQTWAHGVEDEILFWKRYYALLLEFYGVTEEIDFRSEVLHEMTWLKGRLIYPEVIEVLEYFSSHGYKMGVISDTSPSLQLTLEALGLGKYFTSFTASSLVGAMKPDPIIFNAALTAQGISAEESLYVDDYDVEADGAREQGFTSFLIDRSGNHNGPWVIRSLSEMVEFVERKT